MQFDVKIRKVIENGKPLKALASVTVDGSFTIHNVRVIKTENAQFVAMPYTDSTSLSSPVLLPSNPQTQSSVHPCEKYNSDFYQESSINCQINQSGEFETAPGSDTTLCPNGYGKQHNNVS